MKELPDLMKKRGITYKLLAKNEYGYIYSLIDPKSGYDVFERRVTPKGSRTINGESVCYQESVSFPGDRAFGVWAWHYMSEEKAFERFNLLGVKPIKIVDRMGE